MASKPETVFTNAIHRFLPPPKQFHREKMNNPYRGGTADMWYSGKSADLWAEYKFLPRVPQRGDITPERLGLTALQLDWLRGRYAEGRNVCVIAGCPAGGVVLRDLSWEKPMPVAQFTAQLQAKAAIAQWILQQTMS